MTLVLILFVVFLVLGMPIAFAIGISGAVFFLFYPLLELSIPVQLILTQTQSFPILAVPLFVLSGHLLNRTGITSRLINLSLALSGHMRAGMAQTSVILSALMGGVSGSVIADASMQARILGPEMNKRYSIGYSAVVIGFSALIVAAVPPGIGLVLYGSIGEVSIGRLFAGGILPGLLIMVLLMITVNLTARRKGYVSEKEKRAPMKEIGKTFITSIWAFLFPIILILGLRFGYMTPSEAGAFAAVYAIIIGLFAYKELTLKSYLEALEGAVLDIGAIMLLIVMSAVFTYGMIWERIPQALTQNIVGISTNPQVVLLIIVAFLFIVGTFLDSTAAILMLTSMLIPVAREVGVDPVHFGIIFVMILTVGLLTPPVGIAMYSICSVMDCSTGDYLRETIPFFLAVIIGLIIIIFVPAIVLYIPDLIF